MDLSTLTIKKIHQGFKNKEFSCEEVVNAYLKKIESENKKINAFITINQDNAIKKAQEIDKLFLEKSTMSLLSGVPLAVKDNILIKDIRATAGSKMLEKYIAPYDATVISRLNDQGAIFLGKTNMDEFAMGSSGEHSFFGPTKNPINKEYVPGGSSSGSAAAVAANMALFAIGSDTAGSIRQPASFCGVVGMKPTYGAVSRYGLIAMASSLDQIGVIAKNADDAEIVFKAMSGKDPLDSTSCDISFEEQDISLKDLIIGIPKQVFVKGVDKEIISLIQKAAIKLANQGIKIEEVELPHMEYSIACYYIIMPAEVSSNLARYDGIKFGYSAVEAETDKHETLLDIYLKTREQGFGAEPKRRIILGTYVLSSGYYEAYYLQAQKVRAKIIQDFNKVFKSVDMLLMPTSPILPFRLGEKISDPLSMYLCDLMTVSANLAGLPAISLPAQMINGLPAGIQFLAPQFQENKMFKTAKFFEQIWKNS